MNLIIYILVMVIPVGGIVLGGSIVRDSIKDRDLCNKIFGCMLGYIIILFCIAGGIGLNHIYFAVDEAMWAWVTGGSCG